VGHRSGLLMSANAPGQADSPRLRLRETDEFFLVWFKTSERSLRRRPRSHPGEKIGRGNVRFAQPKRGRSMVPFVSVVQM
jgi:hypothetical protein